jgi:luciferase family oxidoreductase group 1
MLPNHAPLMVAERFKVLEALYPGRIDLGLGRAPGTDPITSYALRARQDPRAGDEFLERFQELLLLEHGSFPEAHPFRNVRAVPSDVALPPIWLLGSSGYSAELAAAFGLGFAFAQHFADYDAASAMLSYRERFKPTSIQPRPHAILATAAIAADSDAEAERIAASAQLHYVRRALGEYLPLESPEAAAAYPYTAVDRERMTRQRTRLAIGSALTVKDRLLALADTTRADELMITTMVYDHAARRHSYELLAETFALPR